ERDRVVGRGPVFYFVQSFSQVCLQVGREFFVIPGDCGVGREEEYVGQVVAFGEARRLEIHDGRDEDDAVEGDAVFDEVARKTGGARRAVRFADEEERRS